MKKILFTLVAILAVSVSAFADKPRNVYILTGYGDGTVAYSLYDMEDSYPVDGHRVSMDIDKKGNLYILTSSAYNGGSFYVYKNGAVRK